MFRELDQLFADYERSATESEQLLKDMLAALNKGTVPTRTQMEDLELAVGALSSKYSTIRAVAEKTLASEEIPQNDVTAAEYVRLVKESATMKYRARIAEIKVILERFTRVRSLARSYSEAIKKYQEEAYLLLEQIDASDASEIASFEKKTEAPAAFLHAVETYDTFDTEESIIAAEKVGDYYPSRVMIGVTTKQYFIEECTQKENDDNDFNRVQETAEEAAEASHVSAADLCPEKAAQPEEKGDHEQKEDAEVLVPGEEEQVERDVTETTEQEEAEADVEDEKSRFRRILKKHNVIEVISDDEPGLMVHTDNTAADKKVSSSIFLGDMSGGFRDIKKDILSYAIKHSFFRRRLLKEDYPYENIKTVTNMLVKKGYLEEFTLTPGGNIFFVSKRLLKAMRNQDPAKYVGIKKLKEADVQDWFPAEKLDCIAALTATEVVSDGYQRVSQYADYFDFFKYKKFDTSCDLFFAAGLAISESKEVFEYSASLFWREPAAVDKVLKILQDDFEKMKDDAVVIFSAMNVEIAKGFTDALYEYDSSLLEGKNVFLYGFNTKKYYIYPELKTIDSDQIVPLAYGQKNKDSELNEELKEESHVDQDSAQIAEEYKEDLAPVQKNGETLDLDAKEDITPEEPEKDDKNGEGVIVPALSTEGAESDRSSEEIETPSFPAIEVISSEPVSVSSKDAPKKSITEEKTKVEEKEDSGVLSGPDIHLEDYRIICELLKDRKYYIASAYAQAAQLAGVKMGVLNAQLSHALNDPYDNRRYSTDTAYKLITGYGSIEEYLIVAYSLRTFFSNDVQFDYGIRSYYDSIKEYAVLNRFPVLSNVLYSLADFKDKAQKGMDAYADYHERARADLDRKLSDITVEAKLFYESVVLAKKTENAAQRRFLETKKMMFSATSNIGEHIKLIVDNEADMLPLMEDFLKGFMKDGYAISESALDGNKVWEFICSYWVKAQDKLFFRKQLPLMSSLKTNITTLTNKALSLMIRWYQITTEIKKTAKDEGSLLYKKIRNPLLKNINEASEALAKAVDSADLYDGAGYSVILFTMDEIRRCIEGEAEEDERKNYFIPFLLTDDILLDNNLIPDMDVRHSHLPALDVRKRILAHKECIWKGEITDSEYHSRLDDILNNKEDEYGSALQIIDYLSSRGNGFNKDPYLDQIQESIVFAQQNATQKDDNFLGELEFAQGSGQIDNTVQDMQYLILQAVEAWHEYAEESKNFGFFGKVLKLYLDDIKENAKVREEVLLNQLNAFKEAVTPGIDAEQKEKVIGRVLQMIQAQNYTVAEDLLVRPAQAEFEAVTSVENDFLRNYLDNYDNYYRDLASQKVTIADVLRRRSRNKEQKGANKLADNWLSQGGYTGKDRLTVLLSSLGFRVETVTEQAKIANRYENYIVKTIAAVDGKKLALTHSIAPFGSEAATNGFRAVCVYGNYNADGLIEIMNQIGSNMNALIFLDCALTKGEKRRLARKVKNTLGENLFGVVDRTVVSYLIQNYDAAMVNRMMVSLISPFGYYQPYIWESGFNMPPEIFIGRKRELEQIESPTGVNIVYGGRQLGKSALLKKAQEDIDHDELGDRAVWVEIKEMNYKQAANKVGHELYASGILYEDIDTEDWNEISRALKKRLQDTRRPIPFLLLLLDEADVFIESCEEVKYAPFDALKDVQAVGTRRFKFVIAGLHNIVRFKRDAALSNNSVLTHLSSLTVKPFSYPEARALLEQPLYYLGLRFPKDKEYLITLILATANYFPGLIQMYCAKLLEAMRKNDYAGYSEIDTPVYEVSEKHIKKVLADTDFTREIRHKFVITLMLGGDDYYYILALLIAYLHHEYNSEEGYTPDDIFAEAAELEIQKIKSMDRQKVGAFLEELKELNVLRNTIDDSHYQFSRFSFFQMMGTKAEVENKLMTYMEEE